jgi:hypothetical protein
METEICGREDGGTGFLHEETGDFVAPEMGEGRREISVFAGLPST